MDSEIPGTLMNDERLTRMLNIMLKVAVTQDQQILELIASVAVLKLAIAHLKGEAPESALSAFRDAEQRALKEIPISRELQELRDLIDHGKDYGKHRA